MYSVGRYLSFGFQNFLSVIGNCRRKAHGAIHDTLCVCVCTREPNCLYTVAVSTHTRRRTLVYGSPLPPRPSNARSSRSIHLLLLQGSDAATEIINTRPCKDDRKHKKKNLSIVFVEILRNFIIFFFFLTNTRFSDFERRELFFFFTFW